MSKTSAGGAVAQKPERKKPLVLVVNADCAGQFRTSIILQRLDYHVFSVKSAEDAQLIMELTLPRLIVTEVNLPRLNGIDFLRKVKKDPRTREIPVLVYTALKDQAYRQACMEAGCAGYISQPADPNILYEAVQKATEATPRHFVRLTTSLEVIIGTEGIPGHSVRKEKITALSENGMYVNTTKPLPYGTVLPFTIFLQSHSGRSIGVEGKVLYSHDGSSGDVKQPGMGVKFTIIHQSDKDVIKAYIKAKLMEGIAVNI